MFFLTSGRDKQTPHLKTAHALGALTRPSPRLSSLLTSPAHYAPNKSGPCDSHKWQSAWAGTNQYHLKTIIIARSPLPKQKTQNQLRLPPRTKGPNPQFTKFDSPLQFISPSHSSHNAYAFCLAPFALFSTRSANSSRSLFRQHYFQFLFLFPTFKTFCKWQRSKPTQPSIKIFFRHVSLPRWTAFFAVGP